MKMGTIREEYIAIIIKELLKGLDYLHNEGKLHRGKQKKDHHSHHVVFIHLIFHSRYQR